MNSKSFHQGLVLLASFIGQVISEGIMLSFTVYYPTLVHYFQSTNAEVSLIGTVAYSCWFILGGPLAGHLIEIHNSSFVLLFSGLVGCAAVFAGSFSTQLWHIILSFGLFAFCCGLAFIPSITVITSYYDRHQMLATTAATVGGATGAVCYPLLVQYLLLTETWQYSFVITGGIMLQLVVCAMILKNNHVLDVSPPAAESIELAPKSETAKLNEATEKEIMFFPNEERKLAKTKKINLWLFAFHNLCWNFTVFGFFTVLPLFLDSKRYSVTEIALVMSVFSFAVIVGRCASAVFCFWKNGDRILVFNIFTLFSALFVLLFLLEVDLVCYCTFAALYGFCFGIETGFVPVCTLDIVGHQDLNKSLGFVLFATGIGGLLSPYACGWLIDVTGRFDLIFILGATPIFICCLSIMHLHWPLKKK